MEKSDNFCCEDRSLLGRYAQHQIFQLGQGPGSLVIVPPQFFDGRRKTQKEAQVYAALTWGHIHDDVATSLLRNIRRAKLPWYQRLYTWLTRQPFIYELEE